MVNKMIWKKDWERLIGRKLTDEEYKKLDWVMEYEEGEGKREFVVYLFRNRKDIFERIYEEVEKRKNIEEIANISVKIFNKMTEIEYISRDKRVLQKLDGKRIKKIKKEIMTLENEVRELYNDISRAKSELEMVDRLMEEEYE